MLFEILDTVIRNYDVKVRPGYLRYRIPKAAYVKLLPDGEIIVEEQPEGITGEDIPYLRDRGGETIAPNFGYEIGKQLTDTAKAKKLQAWVDYQVTLMVKATGKRGCKATQDARVALQKMAEHPSATGYKWESDVWYFFRFSPGPGEVPVMLFDLPGMDDIWAEQSAEISRKQKEGGMLFSLRSNTSFGLMAASYNTTSFLPWGLEAEDIDYGLWERAAEYQTAWVALETLGLIHSLGDKANPIYAIICPEHPGTGAETMLDTFWEVMEQDVATTLLANTEVQEVNSWAEKLRTLRSSKTPGMLKSDESIMFYVFRVYNKRMVPITSGTAPLKEIVHRYEKYLDVVKGTRYDKASYEAYELYRGFFRLCGSFGSADNRDLHAAKYQEYRVDALRYILLGDPMPKKIRTEIEAGLRNRMVGKLEPEYVECCLALMRLAELN